MSHISIPEAVADPFPRFRLLRLVESLTLFAFQAFAVIPSRVLPRFSNGDCAMGTSDNARRHGRHARGWGRGRHGVDRGEMFGGPVRPVFSDGDFHRDKPDYKTAALCKQIRRILGMALSGECGDPILQSLVVEEVLPAPHAGRLLVRVILRAPADGPMPSLLDVLERLGKVEGLLRMRIGESIARKRTPELAFEVIPAGTVPATDPPGPEVVHE